MYNSFMGEGCSGVTGILAMLVLLALSYLLLFHSGLKSVCLSCSGVGVCTDNHNRGGDDGDGGGDHVSAEPLQTLCAILHQPAQPGEAERREPLISKSCPALPTRVLCCLPNDVIFEKC